MKLVKAYQYLFYKLYKFYEASTYSRWWSDWKAILSIIMLELFTVESLNAYFYYSTGYPIPAYKSIDPFLFVTLILLIVINYYFFENGQKWKEIVHQFDKLPAKKNRLGTVIVWIIIIGLIANFIYSTSLLSKLNYR